MPEELPEAVRRVVEATNAGDSPAFVHAFTEDGFVDDWGRVFRGHDDIGRWNEAERAFLRSRLGALHADSS